MTKTITALGVGGLLGYLLTVMTFEKFAQVLAVLLRTTTDQAPFFLLSVVLTLSALFFVIRITDRMFAVQENQFKSMRTSVDQLRDSIHKRVARTDEQWSRRDQEHKVLERHLEGLSGRLEMLSDVFKARENGTTDGFRGIELQVKQVQHQIHEIQKILAGRQSQEMGAS